MRLTSTQSSMLKGSENHQVLCIFPTESGQMSFVWVSVWLSLTCGPTPSTQRCTFKSAGGWAKGFGLSGEHRICFPSLVWVIAVALLKDNRSMDKANICHSGKILAYVACEAAYLGSQWLCLIYKKSVTAKALPAQVLEQWLGLSITMSHQNLRNGVLSRQGRWISHKNMLHTLKNTQWAEVCHFGIYSIFCGVAFTTT